jgi:IclR family acetate operon transcriptional repressor
MKVVVTAFRLLEEVACTQPAGVSALARSLSLPKSTVQRSLLALRDAGWIAPSDDDMTQWVLTTRALIVGSNVGVNIVDRRAAREAMQAVNDATSEAVHLVVLDNDEVVLLDRVECKLPVRTYSQVGIRAPLHTTANGKAILAAMDPNAFEAYLAERTLQALTPASIVTIAKLRAEVEQIRQQGYAVSRRENRDDVVAVGAAIRGADGRPVGGLSISAPAHRVTDDLIPGYGELVASAARSLRA